MTIEMNFENLSMLQQMNSIQNYRHDIVKNRNRKFASLKNFTTIFAKLSSIQYIFRILNFDNLK